MKIRELLLVAVSLLVVAQEGALAQNFGGSGHGGGPGSGHGGPGYGPPGSTQPGPPPVSPPGEGVPGPGYGRGGGWDRGGGWGRDGRGGHHHGPPRRGYPGYRPIDPYRAQMIVDALYSAFLFRRADPQGMAYSVYQIQSGGVQAVYQLAQQIGVSPEFNQRILRFYRPEQVVGNAYSVLYRHGPDYYSQYYVQLLMQGRGAEAVIAMVQSQEFSYNYLY